MLRPTADHAQVDWLLRFSTTQPPVVQSYVSTGFAAYARVLNPANGFDGAPVRWSRIAREVGIELTAETQWSDLAADLPDEGELINLDPPDWSPDPGVARALTSALGPYTLTPQDCYFLVWEGYGSADHYFTGWAHGRSRYRNTDHCSCCRARSRTLAHHSCRTINGAELVVAGGSGMVRGQRHLRPQCVCRRRPGVHRRDTGRARPGGHPHIALQPGVRGAGVIPPQ